MTTMPLDRQCGVVFVASLLVACASVMISWGRSTGDVAGLTYRDDVVEIGLGGK